MKQILVLFLLAIALPLFGQNQRRVLVEEFTNASCPPCAAQNPGFKVVLDANDAFLTPIKYQTDFPGYDPMNVHTQAEVAPRLLYYGIGGVPDGFYNGTGALTDYDNGFGLNFFTAAKIQTAYNDLTPVGITLTHQLSPNYDSVYIQVAVTSATALTGTLRLRVAVTESEILFEQAPGTNGETEFYNVMRKMLPNATGTATGDFAAGETKSYTMAWKFKNIYNLNNVEVVAWLQDDANKAVWQSERSAALNNVPEAGAKISAENKVLCTEIYSPKIEVTNTSTEPLTSAALQYRVNNLAWTDYAWTGNIAPGATDFFILPDITFNTQVSQKFSVRVLSTNNGIQTNTVNPEKVIVINKFANTVLAPLSHGFETGPMPPSGWGIINPPANGWKNATYGAFGTSTRSAEVVFYSLGAGSIADLLMPKMDLSTAASAQLTFDHAYTYYSTDNLTDSLQIDVSGDCGENWTNVFYKGGVDLATVPAIPGGYVPAAGDWVSNTIDLSDFAGASEVVVRFRAISGFGNNFYMDNVNLSTIVGVKNVLDLEKFAIQPNPTRDAADLQFTLANAQSIQLAVYNAQGMLVQTLALGDLTAGVQSVRLDATKLPAGSYRVVLQGREGVAQTQWMVIK